MRLNGKNSRRLGFGDESVKNLDVHAATSSRITNRVEPDEAVPPGQFNLILHAQMRDYSLASESKLFIAAIRHRIDRQVVRENP